MSRKLFYILTTITLIVNQNRAQTGAGCFSSTCPNPGQIRMDAVIENGLFVSGCTCQCSPDLYDPSSSSFCHNGVNFDPRTLAGDCSCSQCDPAAAIGPASCIFPRTYDVATCGCKCPSWTQKPSSCEIPTEWVPELCQCACRDVGSVGGPCIVNGKPVEGSMVRPDCTCDGGHAVCEGNQEFDPVQGQCHCPEKSASGAWFPQCEYPLVKDPITCDCTTTTTTLPPAGPISVQCTQSGDCQCPYGTQGDCTITCDGADDACKDGMIECNNDGFDCTVHCVSGSSCAGSSIINGPIGGRLTVNCEGSQSCEGSVVIDNREGTDTAIVCDGGQSCKGSVLFRFGAGQSLVACNGEPDACQGGATFALLTGAQSIAGASFECIGSMCPSSAPAPFSNIVVAPPTDPVVAVPTDPVDPVVVTPINPSEPSPSVPVEPRPGAKGPGTGSGSGAGGSIGGSLPGPGEPVIVGSLPVKAIIVPDEIVVCETSMCQCSNTAPCTIQCIPTFLIPEACANAQLICPKDFACKVHFSEGAGGGAVVTGPVANDFAVTCEGMFSCGGTNFVSAYSKTVSYSCLGDESCMGAAINCGTGHCKVDCSGGAACDGAGISNGMALSFDCYGATAACPTTYTAAPVPVPTYAPTPPCNALSDCPCNYPNCFETRDPVTCQCECPLSVLLAHHRNDPTICGADNWVHDFVEGACACGCPQEQRPFGGCPGGQVYNEYTCECTCPNSADCKGASILDPQTCQCECPTWAPRASDCLAINKVLRDCECACPIPCPGPGQIQSTSGCQCGCPYTTPDPQTCLSGFIDELSCQCAVPLPSDYCCLTTIPNFTPFAGWCWGHQNPTACAAVPDQKCTWNAASCLPSPPVNNLDRTRPCFMRDEPCAVNGDCCSEVCRVTGFCR